jgi:hypothetical protein
MAVFTSLSVFHVKLSLDFPSEKLFIYVQCCGFIFLWLPYNWHNFAIVKFFNRLICIWLKAEEKKFWDLANKANIFVFQIETKLPIFLKWRQVITCLLDVFMPTCKSLFYSITWPLQPVHMTLLVHKNLKAVQVHYLCTLSLCSLGISLSHSQFLINQLSENKPIKRRHFKSTLFESKGQIQR